MIGVKIIGPEGIANGSVASYMHVRLYHISVPNDFSCLNLLLNTRSTLGFHMFGLYLSACAAFLSIM